MDRYEMTQSMKDEPSCFSKSIIKFQGYTGEISDIVTMTFPPHFLHLYSPYRCLNEDLSLQYE